MTFRLGDVAAMPRPMQTRRWVQVRGCEAKLRHATRALAEAHIEEMCRSGKAVQGTLRPYQCGFCKGGWHVGHPKVS